MILNDKDGEFRTDDQKKAEVLNDFFASVFTVDGNSEIPDSEQFCQMRTVLAI